MYLIASLVAVIAFLLLAKGSILFKAVTSIIIFFICMIIGEKLFKKEEKKTIQSLLKLYNISEEEKMVIKEQLTDIHEMPEYQCDLVFKYPKPLQIALKDFEKNKAYFTNPDKYDPAVVRERLLNKVFVSKEAAEQLFKIFEEDSFR